jgi:hypothetical protein
MATTVDVLQYELGIDFEDLKNASVNAERQISGLQNSVKSNFDKMSVGAKNVGKAFEQMPRGSAFNLINAQLAGIAYSMMGTSQAGMAMGSALGIAERAAISMGTGVLPIVGVMAGITGVMILLKNLTGDLSKEFTEFRKKSDELSRGLQQLNVDAETIDKSFRAEIGIIAFMNGVLGLDVSVNKLAESFVKVTGQLSDYTEKHAEETEKIIMENALLRSESIPNLRAMVELYDRRLAKLKEGIPAGMSELEYQKELNILLKDRKSAEEKLTKAIDERNKKPTEAYKKGLEGAVPMRGEWERQVLTEEKYKQYVFGNADEILKRRQADYMANQKIEENHYAYLFEKGQIDLQSYLNFLEQKLAGEVAYSDAWMAIQEQIDSVKEDQLKKWEEQNTFVAGLYKSLGDSVGKVFSDIFTSGKNLTDNLKDAWQWFRNEVVNIIGQILSKWITTQLEMSAMKWGGGLGLLGLIPFLKGGGFAKMQEGGFLKGAKSFGDSVLGLFDPREFIMPVPAVQSIGAENLEYMRKTGEMPGSRGSININMGGFVFHGVRRQDTFWIRDSVTNAVKEAIAERKLEI